MYETNRYQEITQFKTDLILKNDKDDYSPVFMKPNDVPSLLKVQVGKEIFELNK